MSSEVIAAFVGALLPIMLTTLLAWAGQRGQENRRDRAIDATKRHIDFLSAYLSAQSVALSSTDFETLKASIAEEMRRIYHDLSEEIGSIERSFITTRDKNAFQKLFLLYRMRGRGAQILRALYYIFLLLSTYLSLTFITISLTDPEDSLAFRLTMLTILLLLFNLPAIVFRWLAIRRDTSSAPPPRPAAPGAKAALRPAK